MIDPKLLELLACPSCRGRLIERADSLLCSVCGKSYPVRDGVPDFIA